MREAGSAKRAAQLIEFLESKRWFGEKGHEILDACVRDAMPIDWPNSRKPFAVSRVDVTTDNGTSTYQLFSPRAEGREPKAEVDALQDPDFLRGLADVWRNGASFGDGVRWIVEAEGQTPLVVPPNAPVSLSSAEQTNSSVILNREAILKLYRKLEAGVHPDVEVTRFLTLERQFVNVPVLLGTIRFEEETGGGVTIAGMLQEYVQGATDGWTYVLEQLSALGSRLSAPGSKGREPSTESREPFFELGRVVRAMHEALASGDPGSDFDLQPASATDVRRWEAGARQTMMDGWRTLERSNSARKLPHDVRDTAEELLGRRERIAASFDEIVEGLADDAGANTRTHGDLHLGQILRSTAGQFLVIDFEGEPTRPLRERRARSSPLRDVAGMLRSFAYAAAHGSRPSALGDQTDSREPSAERQSWEASVRSAFLRGYFLDESLRYSHPGLLPRSPRNAERLVALFEAEKAFYELQYELAHRPHWVWIPLRGIRHLLR